LGTPKYKSVLSHCKFFFSKGIFKLKSFFESINQITMTKSIFILSTIIALIFSSCSKDELYLESNQDISSIDLPNPENGCDEADSEAETRIFNIWRYNIKLDGKTFNAYPFSRNGQLTVTTGIKAAGSKNLNNGINSHEVGFKSGNPAGSPSAGAIWFGSNTALCKYQNMDCNIVPQNAAIDLVYTKWLNSNTLQVDIDGRCFSGTAGGTSLLGFLNNFNAKSGIIASKYRVISGCIILKFSGNNVTGTINISGSTLSGYLDGCPYVATFSGKKA
jgi:hypothetical protein